MPHFYFHVWRGGVNLRLMRSAFLFPRSMRPSGGPKAWRCAPWCDVGVAVLGRVRG